MHWYFSQQQKEYIFVEATYSTFMTLRPKTHLNQMNFFNFNFFILLIINGKIISNIEKDKSTFDKEK
jgi:hypothetical protein